MQKPARINTHNPVRPGNIASGYPEGALSRAQHQRLQQLEDLEWKVKFICQTPDEAPLIVLHNPRTGRYAVLECDDNADAIPRLHQFRR